ncbi:MAG TPA: 2-succinyl-5-enolpyruvyl-6-hydroxy-3-cyclohexene-1-carboxylic-acid synthase, partial [Ignavibacteriaceae bacterium]|nr:2-succinyl-5-enolpyruvyl-6-hydroxy-3-cyclohexene-1-carboxylic-acid synthase [Ignavibacteriaceae bacterium]
YLYSLMKIKVNRNIIWAQIFIDQLAALGVQYACISPGFRSTPLTYVLSKNRKIKSFINIDERSSAFFALGLARTTKQPVIVVTTSGTAVAELYPAIIEAYQQRTPLIICTADRPPELIGTGANQTINQHNIFKNHIRLFRDLGLPSIGETGFHHLQKIAIKAYQIGLTDDRGPVHLNFPFRKPLEPFSYTDEVSKKFFQLKPQRITRNKSLYHNTTGNGLAKAFGRLTDELAKTEKGIIIAGPMEYDRELIKDIKKLSALLKYPVFADGLSQLRFNTNKKDYTILSNFSSILKSENFVREHEPDVIIQFGRTPTSSVFESFLAETNADRYLVNSFGDKFDPARNAKAILTIETKTFCDIILSSINQKKITRHKSNWLKDFIYADEISEKIKSRIIERAKFPNEPYVINEIFKTVPSESNIFIGNSLPVRDLDNFFNSTAKRFNIFFNRGASGIDGVTSTAFGIALSKKPTVLITGDLSFLHDLNALSIAAKYSIPLIIIVVNNNGGGIFESLPIAGKVKRFREFFITPHNIELDSIVKSFGINHQLITNRSQLQSHLNKSLNKNSSSVLEIQTNAVQSVELRNKYFNEVKKILNKEFQK